MSHVNSDAQEGVPDAASPDTSGHWQPVSGPDSNDERDREYASGISAKSVQDESLMEEQIMEDETHIPMDAQRAMDTPSEPVYDALSAPGLHYEHPARTQSSPPHSSEQYDPSESNEPISRPRARFAQHDELEDDGDEERLDPAWGIKRTNTSQLLGRGQRTASFPAFDEPEHVPQDAFTSPDAAGVSAEPLRADSLMPHVAQPDLEDPDREVEDFAAVLRQSAEQMPETEPEEDRYEEGVPLIDHDEPLQSVGQEALPHPDAAWDTTNEEESSYFSNVVPQSMPAPHLDRKDTADVLETLHMSEPSFPDSPSAEPKQFVDEPTNPSSDPTYNQLGDEVEEPTRSDSDDLWKAALDDDDEFLVEDADDLLPDSAPGSPSFNELLQQPVQATTVVPQSHPLPDSRPTPNRQSSSNFYAPHQPSTTDMSQFSANSNQLSRTRGAPYGLLPSQQQRPSAPVHQESYVDQAKGGYKSPYDLPLELSKPVRRRPQAVAPVQPSQTLPPPPPRSSSMADKQLQPPFSPIEAVMPPPNRSMSDQPPATQLNTSPSRPVHPPRSATSAFFEELPTVSRPRPPSGRYTPQQSTNIPPVPLLPRSPPKVSMQTSPPPTTQPYAQFQLRPPEPLDPFANAPMQPSVQPPSTTSVRYSPAPSSSLSVQSGARPTPSPRYSPAPPPQSAAVGTTRYASQPSMAPPPPLNRYASQTSQPPPPNPVLPFQPRTSSPLAVQRTAAAEPNLSSAPPQTPWAIPSLNDNQAPRQASAPSGSFVPPQRPSTQSPGKHAPLRSFPSLGEDLNRPASVQAQRFPVRSVSSMAPPARVNMPTRGVFEEPDFVKPTDETQHDPLERWKGAPIFRFGFGGLAAVSVPKHVPRFSAGTVKPVMKSTSGEVSIRQVKDLAPLQERVTSFPGPLRTKSKKKEVLTWMNAQIAVLEVEIPEPNTGSLPDPRKRLSEKILLWKVVRALVEHDGVLDGNAGALKVVNSILLPEVHAVDEATATRYRSNSDITGIYSPAGSNVRPEPVDPVAVENLRKLLLKGNRQDAVWHAADNRLWSHALLIASTLSRDLWKQVVHEFVQKEVKSVGTNAESLSALYEIFGGNLDESIDQLVPPSARAGLQMVSRTDATGPTSNALAGLDRWKETLDLVLNNRSPEDVRALATLGRLLSEYGRVEAAHTCSLFARSPTTPSIVGGADDPQASIVLLGADKRAPLDLVRNEDAILLTEVYEFATTVLGSGSQNSTLQHLTPFKFQRARSLAEQGHKEQAQAYCDVLAAAAKSITKVSPYYNPAILSDLEEFTNRLKQIPIQSSSWIVKPSIEKVSNSIFNKLSNFVTGEDSDADAKGSGKDGTEIGPFAHVSGSTPSLSRAMSQSDLTTSYPISAPISIPNTVAGSRYAPNGISSARSSSELTRGRPSLDSQRSPPSSSYGQRQAPYDPVNMMAPVNHMQAVNPYAASVPVVDRTHETPPPTSYIPNTMFQDSPQPLYMPQQESHIPTPPPEQHILNSYTPYQTSASELDLPQGAPVNASYMPPPQESQQAQSENTYGSYMPPPSEHDHAQPEPTYGGYMPPPSGQDQPRPQDSYGGYEAPSQSYGYEPPADTGYVPYVPGPDSPEQPRSKPKSFMDDDDDFPRASNSTSSTHAPRPSVSDLAGKRAKDDAADAAFAAAAEADAQRDKDKAAGGKGWGVPTLGLGGWFSRGKGSQDLDAPTAKSSSSEPKVYKAKLGEDKMSLYYDKELKKWVNPNDPDSGKVKAATPPPPRGMGTSPAPPRSVPLPPSREATPALNGPGVPPQIAALAGAGPPSGATTPPLAGPGSAMGPPPSRPSIGLSNSSSIDDLIGPATGRKVGTKGKAGGKKGRYVDVMAK